MSYSIGGTNVIYANGKIDWAKIVNANGALTINTTMQVTGTGSELANGYYLDVVSSTDLRSYRVLGNCNCNCACACGGGGDP